MARRAEVAEAAYHFDDTVPIGRIFLALDNPRFEPVETENEAIERLCAKEDVLPLARDIVRHGLTPLERCALTPIGKTRRGDTTYWVNEGNRRVCALKLLADPDLAPPKLRTTFERLAANWSPITTVSAAIFTDEDILRLWLDRTHSGPQGGVGRRSWDADQKQRFSGSTKNRLAMAVLDYAEAEGMITKEERKGKLTTAQRFLNPDAFQETLGLDRSSPEDLQRTRPKAEFDLMLRQFMRDLVAGEKVHSRLNKKEAIAYGRTLGALPGVTTTRIDAEPLATEPVVQRRVRRTPRRPEKARHVSWDDDIGRAIKGLGNEKLESLYYSITALELERHAPIVAIGVWAFMETLTGNMGRADGVSFDAFLSKQRLSQLGISGDTRSVRDAISRTSGHGNTTKHHAIAAAFNGDQLNNDMKAMKQVLLKCIGAATTSAH